MMSINFKEIGGAKTTYYIKIKILHNRSIRVKCRSCKIRIYILNASIDRSNRFRKSRFQYFYYTSKKTFHPKITLKPESYIFPFQIK